MDEVKRCPFCGGEAKLMGGKVYTIPEIDSNGAYVDADCGAKMDGGVSDEAD